MIAPGMPNDSLRAALSEPKVTGRQTHGGLSRVWYNRVTTTVKLMCLFSSAMDRIPEVEELF
jgi:hypothetical protein